MCVYVYANIRCGVVGQQQLHLTSANLHTQDPITTLFSQSSTAPPGDGQHIISSNQSLVVNITIIIIIGLGLIT